MIIRRFTSNSGFGETSRTLKSSEKIGMRSDERGKNKLKKILSKKSNS